MLVSGRARHNAYLSIPLIYAMLGQHAVWSFSRRETWWAYPAVILIGWLACWWITRRSATVAGA